MKKKNTSIQLRIFRLYSVIILLIIVIVVVVSYFYIANALRTSAFISLQELTSSLSANIDLEIKKMDDLTLNVLYSYLIKDSFQHYVDIQPDNLNINDEITYNSEDERNTVRQLVDILVAIQGPSLSIPQIMLHTYSGRSISTRSNNYYTVDLQGKDWFDQVNQKEGYMYITEPYQGNDPSMSTDSFTDDWLVSVCRTYFDKSNRPHGIVETKQYCFVLFKEIRKTASNDIYSSAYVIDSTGKVVYPYIQSDAQRAEANYFYQLITNNSDAQHDVITTQTETSQNVLLSYYTSTYTGWTVVLSASERKVLAPLYIVIENLMIVFFIVLIISIVLSYVFAAGISKPINTLSKTLNKFDINDEESKLNLNSDINEIVELNQAFLTMSRQLKTSVNNLLSIQQQEIHSKMLALQSQMNPHFLYNTLSVISAMAEEKMNNEIIEICENISDILRYISSDSSPLVSLSQELVIAEKYLNCLKFRYQSNLIYHVDVPKNMLDVLVPKLSIQPLVENSIKYMGQTVPPWQIYIKGYNTVDSYKIIVSDNGNGFSSEQLDRLKNKMEIIDETNSLPSLKLDGMGILNLYMRLKLSYKEKTYFSIKNNSNGGASVSFGRKGLKGEDNAKY